MALQAGKYGVTKQMLLKIKKLPMNTIGMIEESAQAQTQLLVDTVGWNGKNQFDISVTPSPTTNTSCDISGTTIRVTNTTGTNKNTSFAVKLPKNTDVIVSCDADYTSGVGRVNLQYSDNGTSYTTLTNGTSDDFTEDKEISFACNTGDHPYYRLTLYSSRSTSEAGDVTYDKVMIRNAKITDDTYVPYHAPVEEAKTDNTVIAPVENGTTASQAYAVGEHFMRSGKFATVTASISSGDTLTEGTNYSVGDVASYLVTEEKTITFETVSGVAFANATRSAYRYGKVVFFRFRMVVDVEVSFTSVTRFAEVPYIPITPSIAFYPNNPSTHQQCPYSLMMNSSGQMTFLGTLAAGTYDVTGTYICK